jgi:formylglycine-generating enzyme required for sulfatase activity
MNASRTWVSVSVVVAGLVSAASAVNIDLVTVGNPGNAPDTRYNSIAVGGVAYTYQISKFEVTAGQYAEFLNKVAGVDTYGLYNTKMWSYSEGCKIRRTTGGSGNYSYLVDANGDGKEDADWVNRPVNYVSWGDAVRFANWLHNGQPTGAQNLSTTEDGAYYLNGATTDAQLMAVTRKANATWVVPSEDEWYKASYYSGSGSTYYDYPTGTNSTPSNDLLTPDGGNNANFWQDGGYTIGSPYYRTAVGEFELSDSPYGTFDQGGNVFEWNEAVIGSSRNMRGGGFQDNDSPQRAAVRAYYAGPAYDQYYLGFRVAEVPEPASASLLLIGCLLSAGRGRRRK